MNTLAIDPGNTESGFVVIDSDRRPLWFDKMPNRQLLAAIQAYRDEWQIEHAAIEMVASYGMAVGADVFETCVWIGRFYSHIEGWLMRDPQLVKRSPVKLHHCRSLKAKDSNIRQALVDRFASGQPNHGKGTKAEPGWFYGFHSDLWQAYALAVYVADEAEGVTP
jgi:hypothetical protein